MSEPINLDQIEQHSKFMLGIIGKNVNLKNATARGVLKDQLALIGEVRILRAELDAELAISKKARDEIMRLRLENRNLRADLEISEIRKSKLFHEVRELRQSKASAKRELAEVMARRMECVRRLRREIKETQRVHQEQN